VKLLFLDPFWPIWALKKKKKEKKLGQKRKMWQKREGGFFFFFFFFSHQRELNLMQVRLLFCFVLFEESLNLTISRLDK